jgi:small GTP-binding protein
MNSENEITENQNEKEEQRESIENTNNIELNEKLKYENSDNKVSEEQNNNKNLNSKLPSNPSLNIDKPEITKNDQRISINYDYLFKVSLIGDSGTGKTSVLLRLTENIFNNNTYSTIGVDFKILSVKYNKKLAKIQIWDTCGSERFKSLTTSFIKTCAVFIMIFDLTNRKSFENISYWLNLILDNTRPKVLCLVGNKSDLVDNDESNESISEEEINQLCEKFGMSYIRTSAKENKNIEEMFQSVSINLFNEAEKSVIQKEAEKIEKGHTVNIDTKNNEGGEDYNNLKGSIQFGKESKGKKIKNFIKKKKEKITNCCKN